MFGASWRLLAALALLLWPGLASAITIDFDYTYDTNGFFSGTNLGRRTILQAAADAVASHLTDSLTAIVAGGSNTWTADFTNPSTGADTTVNNLNVPANTLVIYVGAQNLSGELGFGGPGGYSYAGTTTWGNTVKARGQAGALSATPTDFGPWGGEISFDLSANWYFGTSTAGLSGTASDFYSMVQHELGHVLGIGTAPTWNSKVFQGMFDGANAEAAYGGPVPLDSLHAHWADGTTSTLPGTSTQQLAVMDPSLLAGTRKIFTTLDYAGLEDIGWQVTAIPEPGSAVYVLLGGMAVAATRLKRKPN